MLARNLCRSVSLLAAAGLGLTVAFTQAQESAVDGSAGFTAPRTSWGDPDLQGAWDYRSITPLERPRQFGDRAYYTDEEVAELEGRAAERMDQPPDENTPANLVHAQYMTDPGRYVDESRRTSLIIDPPNGRIPELTAAAQERQRGQRGMGAARQVDFERPWEGRALLERCISRGLPGALLPGLYNNNILISQSPGYVAITHEMVHETRVVPLDGRPLTGLRGYMGESRGHWEGDTLVIETTNFNESGGYRGATENLKMIERYTLVASDRIDFRLTFEDETTWVRPWTAAYSMRPTEGGFYEYACHEGNYGLRNILENIMLEERARRAAAADN
jgi:hypothetical protein